MLGVSFDTREENAAFATKQGFPFALVCDTDRAVGVAYGAADHPGARSARRIGVVVGPDGHIKAIDSSASVLSYPKQALAVVRG